MPTGEDLIAARSSNLAASPIMVATENQKNLKLVPEKFRNPMRLCVCYGIYPCSSFPKSSGFGVGDSEFSIAGKAEKGGVCESLVQILLTPD